MNDDEPVADPLEEQPGLNQDPRDVQEEAARGADEAMGLDRQKLTREAGDLLNLPDAPNDIPMDGIDNLLDLVEPNVEGDQFTDVPAPVTELPPFQMPVAAETSFQDSPLDVPAINVDTPQQAVDMTPARAPVRNNVIPPRRPVPNPGHAGVDPKKIRAAQQERIRAQRDLPTQDMQANVDREAAVKAKQQAQNEIPLQDSPQPDVQPQKDPEQADKDRRDKSAANPQGNDKEQRDDLYRAMEEYFASEREFRRKLIQLWQSAKRDLDVDSATIEQIVSAFERGREGY